MLGKGALKNDVYTKRLLHGAAHVWLYKTNANDELEILLQKRASDKRTWPGFYDISAAGHIDLGEDYVTAAIRETREEIGLDIDQNNLEFIFATHIDMQVGDTENYENEFRWVYLLNSDDNKFKLDDGEVESLIWKNLKDIKDAVRNPKDEFKLVPQGSDYFTMLFTALENRL